jgi:hypothetical protein
MLHCWIYGILQCNTRMLRILSEKEGMVERKELRDGERGRERKISSFSTALRFNESLQRLVNT